MNKTELYSETLSQFQEALNFLKDKPEETPETTLKALWLSASGNPQSVQASIAYGMDDLPLLDQGQRDLFAQYVARRLEGEPLAHITERQQFMGIELLAGPQALVPRIETEILGNAVVQKLQSMVGAKHNLQVIDVCTGAANLAIAYAHSVPEARVYAADLSEDAVELARRNVEHCKLTGRVEVEQGDLLAPFDNEEFYGKVDLISCNPPYISSAKVGEMEEEISSYEPRLAFDGGAFGISILQKLIKEAPKYLVKGGWCAFELGLGQGPAIIKRLEKNKSFSTVESRTDENGDVRVVLAQV